MVAKPTSPRMSSGRRVNSCPAGPGALELVVVAMVVAVICGSCGSGSSASSTPAVAASSSTLPKAMCDAPVKLSWASVEKTSKKPKGFRSDSTEIVKDWLPKSLTRKSNKNNDTLKGCPFRDRMYAWTMFHCQIFFILTIILFHSFCDVYSLLPCSRVKKKMSVTQALLVIRSFDPIQVPRKKTCDLAKLSPVNPCICQQHTYGTTT